MKKSIKEKSKTSSLSPDKNTRPYTEKQKGYKEKVFNKEEEKSYEKSDLTGNEKNTSGPKS